jgi:hypothetical protein
MHGVLHCNPKRRTALSPQQIRAHRRHICDAAHVELANKSEE